MHNSNDSSGLIRRAVAGDKESLGALLIRHEDRLRRMVVLRLDARLQGRIDASDVIQEIYIAAAGSIADYVRHPGVPFFVWLRAIASNKFLELHRHHLGTPMRDARREVSLYRGCLPATTSAALAAQLLGQSTGPSGVAIRAELKIRLQEALNCMDPVDREVLALRHFEQLSTAETAQVLEIKEGTAGKRYLRALDRLRQILASVPGGLEL